MRIYLEKPFQNARIQRGTEREREMAAEFRLEEEKRATRDSCYCYDITGGQFF